jgi:hypothetical protein
MEMEIIFIIALVVILSLILLIVTLLSFWKYKNKKLFFVSLIFLVFLARGILLSFGLFRDQIAEISSSGYIWVFDLVILILLYIAYSLKR